MGRDVTRDGRARRLYDKPRTPWQRLKQLDTDSRASGAPGFILPDRREHYEQILAETNPAELVRHIHDIQNRFEQAAAPRTALLRKKNSPDMAYLNTTLARIVGIEPENTTP